MRTLREYRRHKAAQYLNKQRLDSNTFRDEARETKKQLKEDLQSLRALAGEHGIAAPSFIAALKAHLSAHSIWLRGKLATQQRNSARQVARMMGGKKKSKK